MGCRETLQCPFHAWTYDLDGTLRKAPRSGRELGFDPAGFSLFPVAVDTWGPSVFANPDPDAAPLETALGDLPAIVAASGLDLDVLLFHSREEWPIASNWKIAIESYLECYHCPAAHPGFSKVIDVSPDATVNIAPGFPNVSLERWIPDGTHRTVEVTDYFFAPDVPQEELDELMAWDSKVAEEDVSLVESVQRGLDSGTVTQGRLMEESEQLIAAFQRRVHDALVS